MEQKSFSSSSDSIDLEDTLICFESFEDYDNIRVSLEFDNKLTELLKELKRTIPRYNNPPSEIIISIPIYENLQLVCKDIRNFNKYKLKQTYTVGWTRSLYSLLGYDIYRDAREEYLKLKTF